MWKKSILTALLSIALLAACANLPGEVPPTATQPPPATEIPTKTPLEETPTPMQEEEVVVPTLPPSKAAVCVPTSEHEELPETTFSEYPQAFQDYLNSGASPEELAVALIVRGLGPEDNPVWAEDVTGDGQRDVVVSYTNLQQPPQGALLIFTCNGSQYILSHTVLSAEGGQTPRLLHIQDLNANGLHEVVYSSTQCGAHTCFEDLQILGWNNGVFEPLLAGSTADQPYPSFKLTDFDEDGIYDLEVVGTAIGSVGAGPQRDQINIWKYDSASSRWAVAEQTLASSPFRIHLVHDAEAAMDRGEYLIASLLFQQVIEDDTLIEWANEEQEYNTLAAYAYYKRIVAALFQSDRPGGLALYGEMAEIYEDSPQYGFVEMADAFLANSELISLEDSCTSAREYASSHPALVLDPLGSEVYGYANPDFAPADVCP